MNRTRLSDKILTFLIWAFAFITLGFLVWILGYIIINGISHVTWQFISSTYSGSSKGILPMIIITVYVVLISVAISTPIGICSAIYLVEYSKPGRMVRIIRFATETLAGIPSIIYGLFGFILFFSTFKLGFSILSGAITLSIMVLPTVIRTTEESLKSVPNIYREGSLALGATQLITITKVILPCAIPGILTAVILSIGRIVGETAAVYLTAGMVTRFPSSVMDSGRTLAVHLYILAKEGISFQQAFATATVLIIVVAALNMLANIIASKLKKMTIGS